MKAKNLIALILAILMIVTVLTACSSDEKPIDSADPQDSATPDDPPDDGDNETETTNITVWLADWGSAGAGNKADAVHEAISTYAKEKIGVTIDFHWVAAADYATQFSLALSNNEVIDLAMIMPQKGNFTTMYTMNATMDITDLMAEYAPQTLELLGDYVKATTVDGRIHGLPTYRMLNTNTYAVMRTDILEELGMVEAAQNADSWADWEAIMAAFADKGFDLYAMGGGYQTGMANAVNITGYENWDDTVAFDNLGDKNGVIYTDRDGNISLLAERQTWIDGAKRVKAWYDAGYIYPDVFTLTETPQAYIGQGAFAGALIGTEYGAESSLYQQTGYECVCTEIVANTVTSTACQNFGIMVPFTAAEPEAAVRFIELMYTDETLMNLIAWGVEGETYTVKDGEGFYPEGTDISNCGYHYYDFCVGNQFLILPWDGNGADYRERSMENFLSASPSAYLGLTVDLSEYQTLQVAINSVYNEYYVQLSSGNYSDELYNEYMEKLEAAGIDEYLGIYQTQADEFFGK